MKVVSLFSGAGGLDLGFVRAGHKIVWANDLYPDAVETYRANIGKHIVCENISKVASSSIPDCDIVIGGFPCQGFSVANTKRSLDDSRNVLYRELIRVIRDKRPRFFLAENVGNEDVDDVRFAHDIPHEGADTGESERQGVLHLPA